MTDDAMRRLREIVGPDAIANFEAAAEVRGREERRMDEPTWRCGECRDDYWMPDEDGRMRPCRACLKRHKRERMAQRQREAGVSPLHRSCTLDSYEPATRHAEEALRVARQYLAAWDEASKRGQGLYFWGPTGVGKTHLAYAIVNDLLGRGQPALVVREVDLFGSLGARYGADQDRAEQAERMLAAARTAPLLLLDDLGATKWTEAREEARYSIIDCRLNGALPTIVTSNHHPEDLPEAIGERTVSRLYGMCYVIPVTGPDRRRPADRRREC